jgi:hypothetical protein
METGKTGARAITRNYCRSFSTKSAIRGLAVTADGRSREVEPCGTNLVVKTRAIYSD